MKQDKKSIGVNYVYNLIYQVLVLVVPFVLTPYVSRVLSPEGIGEYSYTTTIVGYFVLVGNLGVATYGQLAVARTRENKAILSQTFYEIFFTRFITMMVSLVSYLGFVFLSHTQYEKMYIVLIIQILSSVLDITWLLQGLEEFKKIIVRNIIIKFAGVILVLLFVKKQDDLYKYAFIMNLVTLLGNISIWSYLPGYLTKIYFSEIHLLKHLKESLTFFIPSIATTLYLSLDKTMIEWFSYSTAENGFYEQAHKIEQMAVTAVTSLSVVTMPRMAALHENKKTAELQNIFKQTIQFILLLSIPMCFGLIGVSSTFIPLYLGTGYEKCIPILQIFSLLLVVVGLNNAFGKQILMPIGKQKEYNIGVIIGEICNFALNLILIPHFLSIGAAIASVAAETIILIIFIMIIQI